MLKNHVKAGEFKNKCLKLMDEVKATGVSLTVTKRGRPVVCVVPAPDAEEDGDGLEGMILFQGEDITSTGTEWDAES